MHNIIRVTGSSGAGKTSLSEKLTSELITQGFRPIFCKHSSHKHFFDAKGKDTATLFKAGAGYALIASEESSLLHQKKAFDLQSLPLDPPFDLAILEGWKSGVGPMIYCLKDGEDAPLPSKDLLMLQVANEGEKNALKAQGVTTPIITWETPVVETLAILLPLLTTSQTVAYPLKIAVMAGGLSSRMGSEKANMDYGSGPNLEFLQDLLQPFSQGPVALSQRQEQAFGVADFQIIPDLFLKVGPLGGLLSLLESSPNSAWLIVAADLPNLDQEILELLVKKRNPLKLATVIETERLEPLCAIYEPAIGPHLQRHLFAPKKGLTALLKQLPIEKITVAKELWPKLVNINSPQDKKNL
ncbi:MAG: molybdopterin-guanine dinucleotide biosynthesis protein MobB [SAR324 cluster bacterium]|nr:molybdopterin-guanine dinucleotide biosynthesis protein MobB [SAR324 cluster bacterium]